jgi:hypothetical protein
MPKIQYEDKNFTQATLDVIEQAEEIIGIYQAQGFQLTLRQLYYQFVARDLIPNTERSYKRLGNIISDARRAGMIDWDSIEDRTRYLRSNPFWSSPQGILQSAQASYHRDLWSTQDYRIEVWVEKDALVGVVESVCQGLDVPFFSCRGYVSDSEMWNAAMRHRRHNNNGQEVILLHLGDHDPSGIDMTRDIQDRLHLFTGYSDLPEVQRIALTMDQILDQTPPPNPAKVTDSRYEGYLAEYGDESWELDALEPAFIADLIRDSVFPYRDLSRWQDIWDEQERERDRIRRVIDQWEDLDLEGEEGDRDE